MTWAPVHVGWVKYKDREGPQLAGSQPYLLPINPDQLDKAVAVCAAAEGGRCDAVNMYDRAVVSVGMFQWAEGMYRGVSDLLSAVANAHGPESVLDHLRPALILCNATFERRIDGKWRFHDLTLGEVDNLGKAQQFFLGCSGLQGDWTPEARLRAKTWAACLGNVFLSDQARRLQTSYARSRLVSYQLTEALQIMNDPAADDSSWAGMIRAAFASFSINNSVVALRQLKSVVDNSKHPKWSPTWCIEVLRSMTFSGLDVGPHRYDAIRPMLERMWSGVTLPKDYVALHKWSPPESTMPTSPDPVPQDPKPTPEAHQDPLEALPTNKGGIQPAPVQEFLVGTANADETSWLSRVLKFLFGLFSKRP